MFVAAVSPTRGVRWECPSVSFLFFSPRRSRAPRQVTHSVTLSVGLNSGVPFVSPVSRLLASGEAGPPGHGGGGGSVSMASAGRPGDPCPSCGREARAGRSGSRSLPRRHVSGVPVGNGESQARGEPEFPRLPCTSAGGSSGSPPAGDGPQRPGAGAEPERPSRPRWTRPGGVLGSHHRVPAGDADRPQEEPPGR